MGISTARLLRRGALTPLFLLAACGGGSTGGPGGTNSTPNPPPPAPAPDSGPTAPDPTPGTPLPPAAPVAAQLNTAEFRQSDGPGLHNAPFIWAEGHTGDGVSIAIIDNGIDESNPEFAGRISSLSRDMDPSGRTLTNDVDDHGTNAALVAAAARNSSGILGMAYDAEIMALRTDEPGSCTGTGGDEDCSFPSNLIAEAITYAADNGAKVINISLGGDAAGSLLRSAVADAVGKGSLVVIAAGNDSSDQIHGFAQELIDIGDGGVIAVGSIDEEGAISDFSNRAGDYQDHVLMALGDSVCCVYEDGEIFVDEDNFIYLFAGTSFATPQVSGAAALLASAFPNLTGQEIVELLLDNAHDAGTLGPDAEFGRGILDIAAAFAPSGATALAGSDIAVSLSSVTGSGSVAMGDALATASLPAIVTDAYDRAYEVDLGAAMQVASIVPRLGNALASHQRNLGFGTPDTRFGLTVEETIEDDLAQRLHPGYRAAHEIAPSEVLSARIAMDLDEDTQMAVAYRQEAGGLVSQLQGQDGPSLMLAPSALHDDGYFRQGEAAFAVRHEMDGWGITASAERGSVRDTSERLAAEYLRARRSEEEVLGFGLGVDRSLGSARASLGLTMLDEERTVLGGRFHETFGIAGARTWFIDASVMAEFASRWQIGGQLRKGTTQLREEGLVAAGSQLSSLAWSFDLARNEVFSSGDQLALRIAQPLRVTGGSLDLNLPVSYSYATLQPQYAIRSLSLAPEGREIMGELAWSGPLASGQAAASLFYRSEPGHFEQMPDDMGAAIRWSRRF